MMYDLCIVGSGLWGSAAARHATKRAGNVCLIGPSETPQPKEQPLGDIYDSYNDSARIFREIEGTNKTRSLITKKTYAALKELDQTAGINLRDDVGHLTCGHNVRDHLLPVAKSEGVLLNSTGVRDRFPFLDTKQYGDTAFFLLRHAGYFNPRLLVRAQLEAAKRQGCDVIDDVVEEVEESKHSDGETLMRLSTTRGRTLSAKKVLLCTGAFTELKNLLPKGVKLDFLIGAEFFVKLEVGQKDLERLRSMPPVTSLHPECSIYVVPPVKYPNGKYYIKVGPKYEDHETKYTLQEVKNWYQSEPSPTLVKKYADLLIGTMKDFTPISIDGGKCVEAETSTRLPYCDMVSPRLGLAIGGNGFGAMLSDEMGRMAAEMMAGTENWNNDIPREDLKVRYIQSPSNL